MTDSKIKRIVSKLSKLTDDNKHTDACLFLAKEMKLKKHSKLFYHISKIEKIQGRADEELSNYKNRLCRNLLGDVAVIVDDRNRFMLMYNYLL